MLRLTVSRLGAFLALAFCFVAGYRARGWRASYSAAYLEGSALPSRAPFLVSSRMPLESRRTIVR
jgi:hypothetical protein